MKRVVKHKGRLEGLILFLREERVLLDADLAEIYGVSTKALNQAVKRNAERFPNDFMFQLSDVEKQEVVTNCDHLSRLKYSKVRPYGFTEHGALMVANVLSSKEAVKMSLYVVRAFIKQRKLLAMQSDILKKLAQMDAKLLRHDEALRVIWQELQPLLVPTSVSPKRRIGFGEGTAHAKVARGRRRDVEMKVAGACHKAAGTLTWGGGSL